MIPPIHTMKISPHNSTHPGSIHPLSLQKESPHWVVGMGKRILRTVDQRAGLVCVGLVLLYGVSASALAFIQYSRFGYTHLDLAIFSQVVWNTSRGQLFAMSIHPQRYLGDHVELLLLPISLIYRLWEDPRTLLLLQAIVVTSAAAPIYLFAKEYFTHFQVMQRPKVLALVIVWIFLFNPNTVNVLLSEFHILPFFLVPLFWAYLFSLRNRFWPSMMCLLGALLVREDMGILVAGAGVTMVLLCPTIPPRERLRWIITPIAMSVLWSIVSLATIQYFAPSETYKFANFFFQKTDGEASFSNAVSALQEIALRFFQYDRLDTTIALIAPTLFLPLIGWQGLSASIPVAFGLGLLDTTTGQLAVAHYGVVFVPGLLLGTIVGLKKLAGAQMRTTRWQVFFNPTHALHISIVLLILLPFFFLPKYSRFKTDDWQNPRGAFAASYQQSLRRALAMTASDESVIAPKSLLNHMAYREHLYPFFYIRRGVQQLSSLPYPVPRADVFILDDEVVSPPLIWNNGRYDTLPQQKSAALIQARLEEFQLVPIWEENGVVVFLRDAPTPLQLFDISPGKTATARPLGENLLFEATATPTPTHTELNLSLTPLREPPDYLTYSLGFLNQRGEEIGTHDVALAYGLLASSTIPANTTATTRLRLTVPASTVAIDITIASTSKEGAKEFPSRSRILPLFNNPD